MIKYKETKDKVLFKFETDKARDLFESILVKNAVVGDLVEALLEAATGARVKTYKAWEKVAEELGIDMGVVKLTYYYGSHIVEIPRAAWEAREGKEEGKNDG